MAKAYTTVEVYLSDFDDDKIVEYLQENGYTVSPDEDTHDLTSDEIDYICDCFARGKPGSIEYGIREKLRKRQFGKIENCGGTTIYNMKGKIMKNVIVLTIIATLAAVPVLAQSGNAFQTAGGFGAISLSGSTAFTTSTGNGTATSQNFASSQNSAGVQFTNTKNSGIVDTFTNNASTAGTQTTQSGNAFATGTAFGTGGAGAFGFGVTNNSGLGSFGNNGFGNSGFGNSHNQDN